MLSKNMHKSKYVRLFRASMAENGENKVDFAWFLYPSETYGGFQNLGML